MRNREVLTSFLDLKTKVPVTSIEERSLVPPVLSVVVPCYNHEFFIEQCIESVVGALGDISAEILIGEDDSTDGSRERVIALQKKYPILIRLFLHSRENNISVGGRPTGRFNLLYLLSKTRGKYVSLCDGDDSWLRLDKATRQIGILNGEEGYSVVFSRSASEFKCSVEDEDSVYEIKPQDFMYGNPVGEATASSMWISDDMDAHDLVSLYYLPYADIVLWLSLLKSGRAALWTKKAVMYRRHEGGLFSGLTFERAQAQNVYQWLMMRAHFNSLNWPGADAFPTLLVVRQGAGNPIELRTVSKKLLIRELWSRIRRKAGLIRED